MTEPIVGETGRWTPKLVLCNVTVATFSFADLVAAAVAGGFDAVSLLGRTHLRAVQRDGLSTSVMRRMLDDSGLALTDVEAADDWLSAPPVDSPKWLRSAYTVEAYVDIAAELGASTVVAVHFGAPAPVDEAVERFAQLCDRSAERGLDVALEFPAFATIHDVGTAAEIVRRADRRNGGMLFDTWHHRRGGNDGDAVSTIDPRRVFSVQVADGAREPVGTLLEDVQVRSMPGEGGLDLVALVRQLDALGVRAPVGIEVFDNDLMADGPERVGRRTGDALRGFLAEAIG